MIFCTFWTGTWEVIEEGIPYELQTDDLLILCAGRHHTGVRLCNPGNRHMYFHVLPTEAERCGNKQQGLSERKESCMEHGKENTQKICMDKMEAAEGSEDPRFCAATRLSTVRRSRRSASISMN